MNYIENDQEFRIPFGAWEGDDKIVLPYPGNWNVYMAEPEDAPELSDSQITNAFSQPIGTERLSIMAEGKKNAAIAIEDITRPLPVYALLPKVINELNKGGIASENILIIIGTAAHRPMNHLELQNKLGQEIVNKFKIIIHDFMGPDISFLGWVKGGPVYINKYFLQAELKLCIGSVSPHGEVGFGGGAKMIVPGLAGRLTITHFHGALKERSLGIIEAENGQFDRRAWAEEVARYIGVDAVVCGVINSNRRIAGLFIGDLIQAHRTAAKKASEIGKTMISDKIASETDIVIANSYPLDTDPIQMGKAVKVAYMIDHELSVVINAASDGILYHGMGMGCGIEIKRLLRNVPGFFFSLGDIKSFLRSMVTGIKSPNTMARLVYYSLNHLSYESFKSHTQEKGIVRNKQDNQHSMLVYSKMFPAQGLNQKYPDALLVKDWSEIVRKINDRYQSPNIVVLPCAPIQLISIVEN